MCPLQTLCEAAAKPRAVGHSVAAPSLSLGLLLPRAVGNGVLLLLLQLKIKQMMQ